MNARPSQAIGMIAALGVILVRGVAAQDAPACAAGEGAPLLGFVIDEATRVPLEGADVTARWPGALRATTTDERGRFHFCGVGRTQNVRLTGEYASVQSAPRTVVGTNDGAPVGLSIDLGTPSPVSITVTDASDGSPIDGVTLRLEPGIISNVTNEAGAAGLGQVPPGEYRLLADHLAFEPFDGEVFVVPGEQHQLSIELTGRAIALAPIDVEIESGDCAGLGMTSVSGRVVDLRTDLPMSGARVTASRYGGDGFVGTETTAQEDGGFVICGLPVESRIRLEAMVGLRRSDVEFLTVEPGGPGITLAIDNGEPGFVAMHVIDESTGRPVEGAMIKLSPLPLGGITNERGRIAIRDAPPGRYEVRVDHFAFASFKGFMTVDDMAAEEWEIPLSPTAISLEPIEVQVSGRDPYLLGLGFYDRMMDPDIDGQFFDYWDFESYYTLGTFTDFKTFVRPEIVIPFVNGKLASRTGYESLSEIPFGKIRGVEYIRCIDLPPEMARWIDDFEIHAARQEAGHWDCVAQLIWRGERRVRAERDKPTDRCAIERRAELECRRVAQDTIPDRAAAASASDQ